MSIVSCSCDNPAFGNMGRPNCVIEMKAIAFPIIVPRFDSSGNRNTIDLSSGTLGADIQALLSASLDPQNRIYPFPRCENITFERTETVYETAPSTRKYKIEGVGGVRTFNFETWAKDAVHTILQEMLKYGCSDLDFYLVTVDGYIWGIKDDLNDTVIRGYEMATETFDAFKEYATDTTVQKIMASWDLDNFEVEACSYAITSEELGYKATSLRGNVSGYQINVSSPTLSTLETTVIAGFGSAGNRYDITGLTASNFTITDITIPASPVVLTITPPVVESPDGTYLITLSAPMSSNDVIRIEITAGGYDVDVAEITIP